MLKAGNLSELALYRKYRSATFDAVVGQPHIVGTLKNAIATGRLSHAYLFTGPRGVGKTSVARLLARSVNCTGEAKPCNNCENCKTDIGSHLDLLEIDAASHRGIDDARNLREKINLAPSMGKYKVYIIDEVHMLTTEAFNALLKTIEEPPPHAIFILATTESHKLPETIISRTQRFQFRPIGLDDLRQHLASISQKEGVDIDSEALELIARASNGGFRDAISMLDQAAGSGAKPISAEVVRKLLGWADTGVVQQIVNAIKDLQPLEALKNTDKAFSQGAQPTQVISQLIDLYRADLRNTLSSGVLADTATELLVSHQARALQELVHISKSPWPQLALEAVVVKLSMPESVQKPIQQTKAPAQAAPRTAPAAASTDEVSEPIKPQGSNEDLWMKALAQIKQRNNSLYALLRSSCTAAFEGDELTLGCRFSFHRDRLKESKNIQIIEQVLARVYGRKIKVSPQLETKSTAAVASADSGSELVSSALEILGGEVIE